MFVICAEYTIVVRGDMTGLGLGILLIRRIIDCPSVAGSVRSRAMCSPKTRLYASSDLGFTDTTLKESRASSGSH